MDDEDDDDGGGGEDGAPSLLSEISPRLWLSAEGRERWQSALEPPALRPAAADDEDGDGGGGEGEGGGGGGGGGGGVSADVVHRRLRGTPK